VKGGVLPPPLSDGQWRASCGLVVSRDSAQLVAVRLNWVQRAIAPEAHEHWTKYNEVRWSETEAEPAGAISSRTPSTGLGHPSAQIFLLVYRISHLASPKDSCPGVQVKSTFRSVRGSLGGDIA